MSPRKTPDIHLSHSLDETLKQLGDHHFSCGVCHIDKDLAGTNLDRIRANRLAAEATKAALVQLKLPVVPSTGQLLTLHISLKEGVTLVGTAVVHGINCPIGAKYRDPFVVMAEQFLTTRWKVFG